MPGRVQPRVSVMLAASLLGTTAGPAHPASTVTAAQSTAPAGKIKTIERFVRNDGAITVSAKGNFVDPYFANKALITAFEAGLEVTDLTRNWLAWLLPRQRADGSFNRFCEDGTKWLSCWRADADDSTLATFLQVNALFRRALQGRTD